jgi:putative endopeptidase
MPNLGKAYTDILFSYLKARTGQTEQQPRWKKILGTLNSYLGEAVGKLYVEAYFPPEKKADVLDMIEILFESIKVRINNAAWMNGETKSKALGKVSTFRVKIGYPDKWYALTIYSYI